MASRAVLSLLQDRHDQLSTARGIDSEFQVRFTAMEEVESISPTTYDKMGSDNTLYLKLP